MSEKSFHTSGNYEEKQQEKQKKRTSAYKSSQEKSVQNNTATSHNSEGQSKVGSTSFSSRESNRNHMVKTQKERASTTSYNTSQRYDTSQRHEQKQQQKYGYEKQTGYKGSVRKSNTVHTGSSRDNREKERKNRGSTYRNVRIKTVSRSVTPHVRTGGSNINLSNSTRQFIQQKLDESDDTGLQAMSKGIAGAYGLKRYYETVYKGTTLGLNIVKTTTNTGYKIATGAYRSTASTMRQFCKYGVGNTIHYRNAMKVAKVVGNKRTAKLSNGITVIKRNGSFYVKGAGTTVVKMGRASLKTALKSGYHVVKTATSQGLDVIEQGLDSSDDLGAQTISAGIKTAKGTVAGAKVGVKATRFTYRGVKTGAKVGVKTAKTAKKAVKYVYENGWKKSAQELAKVTAKTAKNVIHGLINVIKSLLLGGGKAILVGVIGFVILALVIGISVPTLSLSVIFGGVGVNTDNTTWDIHDYVLQQTQLKVDEYADDVLNNYNKLFNSGEYEIITLYNNLTGAEVAVDKETIKSSIPTAEDFAEVIEPVYYVLMITRYEFSPTETEKKDTYEYLWDMIDNMYTQKLSVVYCTESPAADGAYYAGDGCLRPSETQYHTSYSGESCCYQLDDTGEEFSCEGYQYCLGHRRARIVLDFNGINALIAEEWGDRINDLELKGSLTDAEIEELKNLTANKAFCLEYVAFLSVKDENYNAEYSLGGGGVYIPTVDVSDYDYELSGNPTLGASIAIAGLQKKGCNYAWGGMTWCYDTSQAGTVGVDCSGFTYLIMQEHGITIPRTSAAQAQGGVAIASLEEALPGDLVFYGRNGVSGVGHVGIYIGGGQIVHASNPAAYPQGGVKISNATYKPILAIRRYW